MATLSPTPAAEASPAQSQTLLTGDYTTVTLSSVSCSTVSALTNTAGVVNIDLAGGANKTFTITLTANVTSITFSNLPASGYVGEIEVEIKQDSTGGRTLALPSSFKALGGSDTSIASAANAVTVISAKTFDQGTTWRYAMQESA